MFKFHKIYFRYSNVVLFHDKTEDARVVRSNLRLNLLSRGLPVQA